MSANALQGGDALLQLSKHPPKVLVIGSGAGGASVAYRLACRGVDVAVLEMGPSLTQKDFSSRPYEMFRKLYVQGGMTGTFGNTVISLPFGSGLGGTTTINSGTCFRPPPEVLASWKQDFSLNGLDMDCLEQRAAEVETLLGVSEAPRELAAKNNRAFERGAGMLGLSGGYLRRNAPGCKGCGICCFGCPSGAKTSMERSFIPMAVEKGLRVYTQARLERLHLEGARVKAVTVCPAGEPESSGVLVKVETLVLSGGAIFSPLLLLNQGGGFRKMKAIGRHLRVHPATKVLGDFDEPIVSFKGVPQAYYVDSLKHDGIMLEGASMPPDVGSATVPFFGKAHAELMACYNHLAAFGVMVSDTSSGRVVRMGNKRFLLWYNLNRTDTERFKDGIALAARVYLAAGAKRVFLPTRPTIEVRSEVDVERFRSAKLKPRNLELAAFHPMGTLRMGADPKKSVVDDHLKVHGLANLFVCDASIFPSSLGVNPQISVMAFGFRLADDLARESGLPTKGSGV